MSAELVFEEPEPIKTGQKPSSHWADIADTLRSRPEQWAVIATDASQSTASNFRRGLNASFRPVGDWEFVARGMDATTRRYAKVYGRYVGRVAS